MKLLMVASLLPLLFLWCSGEKCTENQSLEPCPMTEYEEYRECMRRRQKRSIECANQIDDDCESGGSCVNSCKQCDCDYCSSHNCEKLCSSCCSPVCSTTHCCHEKCNSRCKTTSCRSSCRKSCREKIVPEEPTVIVQNNTEKAAHNITTIINLHNMINNTNIIDIPIKVNSTNINNFTITERNPLVMTAPQVQLPNHHYHTQHQHHHHQQNGQPCCHVVGPMQCTQTDKFPYMRCYHNREHKCGEFCNAPIVHSQPHEVCEQSSSGSRCHQQIIYIPQPKPKCFYQPQWPYVSCGLQNPSCEGCYNHYAQTTPPQLPSNQCPYSCYDDGYGLGPYFRQGPFYRPNFSHVPSCYQLGLCDPYGSMNGLNFGVGGAGLFPYAYESTYHIETDPNNVMARTNPAANETSPDKKDKEIDQFYPLPFGPNVGAFGIPMIPPVPFKPPPEVAIETSIEPYLNGTKDIKKQPVKRVDKTI